MTARVTPTAQTWPELLIIRPLGAIDSANARRLYDRELELVDTLAVKPVAVIADCSAVPDADVTAIDQAEGLHDSLADRGIELWFSGPKDRFWRCSSAHRYGRGISGSAAACSRPSTRP